MIQPSVHGSEFQEEGNRCSRVLHSALLSHWRCSCPLGFGVMLDDFFLFYIFFSCGSGMRNPPANETHKYIEVAVPGMTKQPCGFARGLQVAHAPQVEHPGPATRIWKRALVSEGNSHVTGEWRCNTCL